MNNLQQHFSLLQFVEETHTYTVNGNRLPSVSGLVGEFYEHFNAKKVAPWSAKKEGVTVDEIIKKWDKIRDEAAQRGTDFHNWAEDYVGRRYLGLGNMPLLPTTPMEEVCIEFWDSVPEHYKVVDLELRMYHEAFEYAGTADVILFNEKTEKYVVLDYKTNKDLFKNYKGKLMKMPFQEMLDNPLSHYELQLSYYQMMLENKGFEVEERWVLHVNHKTGEDDNIQYKVYKTEDHSKKLMEYHKHKELYDWLS